MTTKLAIDDFTTFAADSGHPDACAYVALTRLQRDAFIAQHATWIYVVPPLLRNVMHVRLGNSVEGGVEY